MKRAVLFDIVILALVVGASPATAQYNWTGWYVGVNAGGAWGDSDVATSSALGYFTSEDVASIRRTGKGSVNPSGFTGGAQGGYNWQTGSVVLGLEADFEYLGQDATRNVGPIIYPGGGPTYSIKQRLKTDNLFTLRPRVGWAANNLLFYISGGLAVSSVSTSFNFTDTFAAARASGSKTSIKPGWTVGGGVEFGLTPSWTLRGEYLFVNMSTVTAHSSNLVATVPFTPTPIRHKGDLESHIVRAALNFKF
jgi:outer membrane immunogenic protein